MTDINLAAGLTPQEPRVVLTAIWSLLMKSISLEYKQLTVWLSIKAVSKDSELDHGEI